MVPIRYSVNIDICNPGGKGNPLIFESFLNLQDCTSKFEMMAYYEPYIYDK